MKLIRNTVWLILVAAFMVSGCRRVQKKEISATEPNIEPLVFIADYASDAIEATGGMDVWMKTKKLELDCVVTVYEPDDSLYLTEHHFEVYPWLNSIKISAQEPLNRFVWQLSEGRFNVLEGDEKGDVSPPRLLSKTETGVSYRDYAEAILNVITAPVRLVDESFGFIKGPGPVKMEGLWYYPIEQTYLAQKVSGPGSEQNDVAPIEPYWSKVVFFQNRDSSIVDMVWFAKVEEKKFLAVRGYDYKPVLSRVEGEIDPRLRGGKLAPEKSGGVLVPTKIEIFTTDARSVIAKRLVKIDFK